LRQLYPYAILLLMHYQQLKYKKYHHHHISVMELGHLLIRSGLTLQKVYAYKTFNIKQYLQWDA